MAKTAAVRKQPAPKPAPPRSVEGGNLDSFLAQISTGLDERLAEAQAAVGEKESELETAHKNLRLVESLIAVRDGKFQPGASPAPVQSRRGSSGPRQPREAGRAIAEKIKGLLADNPDGMPVAEIIKAAGAADQAVRNQLARMTKAGEIANPSKGSYSLP